MDVVVVVVMHAIEVGVGRSQYCTVCELDSVSFDLHLLRFFPRNRRRKDCMSSVSVVVDERSGTGTETSNS
jgi:hypothetical protein